MQIRLAPQELTLIQRAAARWVADAQNAPRPRATPSAAGTTTPSAPSPRRRYTPVPRYIRAQMLAVAAQATAGAEARAELDAVTAFRHEVRRVGSLLNQAIRHAHTGRGTGPLIGAIDEVGRTLGEVLKAVTER